MRCVSRAGAKHSHRRVLFHPHYSQEVDFVPFPEDKSEQWQSPELEAKKKKCRCHQFSTVFIHFSTYMIYRINVPLVELILHVVVVVLFFLFNPQPRTRLLVLEKGKGREERAHRLAAFPTCLNWGLNMQPRYVP